MKMLLTGFILVLSITAKCQLEKSTWLVGGSGSLNTYNQTYTSTFNLTAKYRSIDISAPIGYFYFGQTCGWNKTFFFFFKNGSCKYGRWGQ